MIISTDTEKKLTKLNTYSCQKFSEELKEKGIFLNIIKSIYEKPTTNLLLDGEKLNTFPLLLATRREYLIKPN